MNLCLNLTDLLTEKGLIIVCNMKNISKNHFFFFSRFEMGSFTGTLPTPNIFDAARLYIMEQFLLSNDVIRTASIDDEI